MWEGGDGCWGFHQKGVEFDEKEGVRVVEVDSQDLLQEPTVGSMTLEGEGVDVVDESALMKWLDWLLGVMLGRPCAEWTTEGLAVEEVTDEVVDVVEGVVDAPQQTLNVTFKWLLLHFPPTLLCSPSGVPVEVLMK